MANEERQIQKNELESLIVKKNAIQIPWLTASAANASGFLLAVY
jgi:hypothetical protein